MICADCGQEKPHCAKGLCKACYMRQYKKPTVVCAECGREKPHKAKGLCGQCYMRRWQKEHQEERLAYMHRWHQEHQEEQATYYQMHREEKVAYYQAHREEKLAYVRCYQTKHREEKAASDRRWQQENPERVAVNVARRKAFKRSLPDTLTPEQAEQLFAIGRAMYPGEKLALDHIVPLSQGGGTTLANCHYIPAGLNLSKHNALPEEVYRQATMEMAMTEKRGSH